VVTYKIKHLQKCCKNVLVFFFLLHVTTSKIFLECFTLKHLQNIFSRSERGLKIEVDSGYM